MRVKAYTLINEEKAKRVLDGGENEHGELVGGIRDENGHYNEDELLANYDKIGGLIRKGEDKVRMGSFYDFRAKKPRVTPQVEFEFRVNGEVVFVPEDKEVPNAVKAVKIAEKAKKTKE